MRLPVPWQTGRTQTGDLRPTWGGNETGSVGRPSPNIERLQTIMMNEQRILSTISDELGVSHSQVKRTAALFDEGNTIPFVARYRKEVTGGLDEAQLRTIRERLTYLRNLEERKATVLSSIEEQGKLTAEMEASIREATTLQQVEDLYRPYRPKRRTRATIARERGLEPLAERIVAQAEDDPEGLAEDFLTEEVPTAEDALAGARDIVAETVADDPNVRDDIRRLIQSAGQITASLVDAEKDPRGVYEAYYDFSAPVAAIRPHQLLALNRGEDEGALRVHLEIPDESAIAEIQKAYPPQKKSKFAAQLAAAIGDGWKRLLGPSVERETRSNLTEDSDRHATGVFAENLRNLLLQPPLRGPHVMGIDPGYRTGSKVALVDETGKFIGGTTIYPHEPQRQWDDAKGTLHKLIDRAQINVVAVGNGTASRETEQLVAEVIGEINDGVSYAIVSEAGASVYSASELARQELPDLDVSMRGAVSIARRLQDPLAELVKIDPRSVGVGLYQHDVDQKHLSETLDTVVESVVNQVGVDLNTASPALLRYVAGLTSRVTEKIVKYREENGPFATRRELLKVKGLGPKTFEQAAGFLKLPEGERPLENTFIHPESYGVVEGLFARFGLSLDDGDLPSLSALIREMMKEENLDVEALAEELDVGVPTLTDILADLAKPGRDPRDSLPPPMLRQDVLKIEDLKPGMWLKGTVRNVVDFGAFVDVGVKQDGLVHVSEMAERYVRNPYEVVAVGDVVDVRVIKIDVERGRIGLSMKS
ncbi:MAG: Protein YhgF [Anaerolineales bacterium]|nr:Protein YhgF [Anaerolineales bacterium]